MTSSLTHLLAQGARGVAEQIDALWLRGSTVVAAFEVEDSTPVYSGLARETDLVRAIENIGIRVFIVAPETKVDKVKNEFNRAIFRDIARRNNWKYILYPDLARFCNDLSGKSYYKLKPESLDQIAHSPFV